MGRLTVAAVLGLVVTLGLGAQGTPAGPRLSIEGARLFGGDLGLTWGDWKAFGGAGWETLDLGRDLATGAPVDLRPGVDRTKPFHEETYRNLGGFVRYRWSLAEAELWAGAGALGWENFGVGDPAPGRFSDRTGGLFAYGRLGATRDRQTVNDRGVKTGTFAEALVEAGPSAASVRRTDYAKVSWVSSALVPLWDLPGPSHRFSGVLGLRGDAQWIDGQNVPVPLLEPTEVRGTYRTFDTKVRSVATAELRVKGPSLWGAHDLVPVAFGFVEGGWWAGYADAPAAQAGRSGWLAGTGVGVGLDVGGLTTPTLTLGLPLAGGDSGLWSKLSFNLRF